MKPQQSSELDFGQQKPFGNAGRLMKKFFDKIRDDYKDYKKKGSGWTEHPSLPLVVEPSSNSPDNKILDGVSLVRVISLSDYGSTNENIKSHGRGKPHLVGMIYEPNEYSLTRVKFNKSGRYLAAVRTDFSICVMKLAFKDKEFRSAKVLPLNSDEVDFNLHTIWRGHESCIKDFDWSANDFVASFSNDNIIRIWHVESEECLCCLIHTDAVTALAFHPEIDHLLIATTINNRIRMWTLRGKKVVSWNESTAKGHFTALALTTDASFCAAGTSEGDIIFYELPDMKYHTQIEPFNKLRAKFRVTGIVPVKCSYDQEDRLLISTSDSYIRLYNVRDKSLYMKCKGLVSTSQDLSAILFMDSIIIAPSEDKYVYFWRATPSVLYTEGKPIDLKLNYFQNFFSNIKDMKTYAMSNPNTNVSLTNWERFKLPKSVEGPASVSAASIPGFKYNDSDQFAFYNDISSTVPQAPHKEIFHIAVGANNFVYIYGIECV